MKKNMVCAFFVFSFFAGTFGAAPTSQEQFLRANKLYQQDAFSQALAAYEEISAKGVATWYNMGLCWYRLGDFAHALVCLRRAERLATFRELPFIERAIACVVQSVKTAVSVGFSESFFQKIRRFFSLFSLLVLQLLLLFGMLFVFVANFLRGKPVFRLVLFVLGAFFIGVGSAGVVDRYVRQHVHKGAVVVADTSVYAGPDSGFHSLGSLGAATEITVYENSGSWYKVAQKDVIGWVPADMIVVI